MYVDPGHRSECSTCGPERDDAARNGGRVGSPAMNSDERRARLQRLQDHAAEMLAELPGAEDHQARVREIDEMAERTGMSNHDRLQMQINEAHGRASTTALRIDGELMRIIFSMGEALTALQQQVGQLEARISTLEK